MTEIVLPLGYCTWRLISVRFNGDLEALLELLHFENYFTSRSSWDTIRRQISSGSRHYIVHHHAPY